MISTNRPADPRVHELASAIARRYVELIAGLLRVEERGEALREAYMIAREELETLEGGE